MSHVRSDTGVPQVRRWRTDTYIQNVQDWLARNGYDAVFDTGGSDPG